MTEDDAVAILLELAWARGMGAAGLDDRRALADCETFLFKNFDGMRGHGVALDVVAVVRLG